jgi:ubiquinone/menaquinone biosynthesis C-methylase UbiE
MKLTQSKNYWNKMGEVDPMWAVLSEPDKLGGHWDADEFFATGLREIDAMLEKLYALGLKVDTRHALDFGCGLGRLSQALARHFDRVTGVDVSSTMVEKASALNRVGDRCMYVVNDSDDLTQFPSETFTMIYSRLVLQHIDPAHSQEYLREFTRVIAPGGTIVFQLPEREPRNPRHRVAYLLRKLIDRSPALVRLYRKTAFTTASKATLEAMPENIMQMEGIDPPDVVSLLEASGVTVVHHEVEEEQSRLGPLASWLYVAMKPGQVPR